MSDYSLQITFRNAKILRALSNAGFESQAEFARAAGINPAVLNALVGMRRAPILPDGTISKPAQQLLDALCLLPEDLWTEEQLYLQLERNRGECEISTADMRAVIENKNELRAVLARAKLTPRELNTLTMRHLQDKTYGEAAAELGVSPNRARQIEQRAVRKCRNAARLIGATP